MALALKSHRPISSRSPFFIDCVAFSGNIVSATLTVTVQLGDRRSIITSMTDVKSYTLTKTDAIDGIIVFDIAPLIRDFYEHKYLDYTTSTLENVDEGGVFFVKVVKEITNNFGVESPVTDYYTCKDGYASFKDGVNFEPSTGATGNYPFPATVAYGTDQTLMATDCYRQIGTNSYAVLGVNLGEWERINSESASFVRVKFGAGETWKTSLAATTNVKDYTIAAVESSGARYDTVEDSLKYAPLGKVNMFGDWETGFDYLRVGHFVKASEIGGTIDASTTFSTIGNAGDVVDNGNNTVTFTVPNLPIASQTTCSIAIDECLPLYPNAVSGLIFDVVSVSGFDITVASQDQSEFNHLACAIATGDVLIELDYEYDFGADLIASINNQPILRYEIICEPKYNVIDCLFINKWGCWDSFSFLKKSIEAISVSSSEYNKSIGFVDRGPLGIGTPTYSYSLTDHQKVRYNKNGFKSITCNTGFVNESFNLLLEELMLSEKVYLIIDDVVEPVALNTSNIEFKQSVNDKMINYTLRFDFAYDTIQSSI